MAASMIVSMHVVVGSHCCISMSASMLVSMQIVVGSCCQVQTVFLFFFTKCHVPLLAGLKLILVVVKLAT